MCLERALRRVDGKKVFLTEDFARAYRHQLDEAKDQAARRGELCQWNELIFVAPAHQNSVEFDLFEAGGDRGRNSFHHLREKIAAGDRGIEIAIQRIERDVDGTHARFTQRGRHGFPLTRIPRKQSSVGRQTDIADAGHCRNGTHEFKNIAARQRFAASNPHFRNAELGADANDAQRFLERKNVCARQPFLQLLRHAVMATLVAAVRDRDTQIRNAMPVSIFHDAES